MSFSHSLGRSRAIDRAQHASAPGFAGVTPIGAGQQLGSARLGGGRSDGHALGRRPLRLWVEGLLAAFNRQAATAPSPSSMRVPIHLVTPDLPCSASASRSD